jgi:predicted amidohydrolase YtcJ
MVELAWRKLMDDTQTVDLAIRGGVIVTASSRYRADIGVRDARITQIGGEFSSDREIDANGKLVLPGGIDMHVHVAAFALSRREPVFQQAGKLRAHANRSRSAEAQVPESKAEPSSGAFTSWHLPIRLQGAATR